MGTLSCSEGKGHTFESCRLCQFLSILEGDKRDPIKAPALADLRIRASQQFDENRPRVSIACIWPGASMSRSSLCRPQTSISKNSLLRARPWQCDVKPMRV